MQIIGRISEAIVAQHFEHFKFIYIRAGAMQHHLLKRFYSGFRIKINDIG